MLCSGCKALISCCSTFAWEFGVDVPVQAIGTLLVIEEVRTWELVGFWAVISDGCLLFAWVDSRKCKGDQFFNWFCCKAGSKALGRLVCFRCLFLRWYWKVLLTRGFRSWSAGVALRSGFLRLESLAGPLEALAEWPNDRWIVVVVLWMLVLLCVLRGQDRQSILLH